MKKICEILVQSDVSSEVILSCFELIGHLTYTENVNDFVITLNLLMGGQENTPAIGWEYVKPFIPGIIKHINHHNDHVRYCAVWTLEEVVAHRSDDEKRVIIDTGVCNDLINILE